MNPYYDEIVVGSSLRALLFAAKKEIPIFFSDTERPHQFDHLGLEDDLSSLGLSNEPQVWKTPVGYKNTGQPKTAIWEHIIFVLGLKGLVPFSDLCYSLRLEENQLTGFSEYSKLRTIEFGKCFYFDEHGTYNLLSQNKKRNIYHVYDRLAFFRGGKHDLDLIESDDDFCNKIWFYLTPRVDGRLPFKDACVFSILSEEQIDDFDFSETLVRLETLQKMKNLGLRGPRNGYQKDGSIRYRSFKVEALRREVRLASSPDWIETPSIKSPKIPEKELIKQLPLIVDKHKRIFQYLWQNTSQE